MAKQYPQLEAQHIDFIQQQPLFFIGTATADSRVNVSPKGLDSLRIISPERILWLNLTGSGNESAAHVALNSRMTLMFCAFTGNPVILRVYGQASVVHPYDEAWSELRANFPPYPGARQIFDLVVELVQTSCGFGVPFLEPAGDRPTLNTWAEAKGTAGIEAYWRSKNQLTIDGIPTHILPPA